MGDRSVRQRVAVANLQAAGVPQTSGYWPPESGTSTGAACPPGLAPAGQGAQANLGWLQCQLRGIAAGVRSNFIAIIWNIIITVVAVGLASLLLGIILNEQFKKQLDDFHSGDGEGNQAVLDALADQTGLLSGQHAGLADGQGALMEQTAALADQHTAIMAQNDAILAAIKAGGGGGTGPNTTFVPDRLPQFSSCGIAFNATDSTDKWLVPTGDDSFRGSLFCLVPFQRRAAQLDDGLGLGGAWLPTGRSAGDQTPPGYSGARPYCYTGEFLQNNGGIPSRDQASNPVPYAWRFDDPSARNTNSTAGVAVVVASELIADAQLGKLESSKDGVIVESLIMRARSLQTEAPCSTPGCEDVNLTEYRTIGLCRTENARQVEPEANDNTNRLNIHVTCKTRTSLQDGDRLINLVRVVLEPNFKLPTAVLLDPRLCENSVWNVFPA